MQGTGATCRVSDTVPRDVNRSASALPACVVTRGVQFVKFCLVGGIGLIVDMLVLFALADPETLALNVTFSKIIAAQLALLNNFAWNELWTFKQSKGLSNGRHGWFFRLLRFNAICGIGILIATLLVNLFYQLLGWNLYLSNLFAIVLVTLWNFALNARFNWGLAQNRSVK